jgi:hypothetical protein
MRTMALIILLMGFRISESAILSELGMAFYGIKKSGSRVLTRGSTEWILWDAQSKTPLLHNENLRDLAGDVLVEYANPLVKVYDARTLALKASFPAPIFNSIGLGKGGNFIWIRYNESMELHDLEGKLLRSKDGDYRSGHYFVDSSEILVHKDPSDSIEVFSAKDGSVKAYPFLGDFSAWFLDGTHFVTTLAGLVRIYNRNGVLEQSFQLERTNAMGGYRGYFWASDDDFWANDNSFRIYSLENPTTPVKNVPAADVYPPEIVPFGSKILLWPTDRQDAYYTVDLGAEGLPIVQEKIPFRFKSDQIDSDPEWWLIGWPGLLATWDRSHPDVKPQFLFPGDVKALAGGPSDVFAAGTVSGINFIFRHTEDSAIVLKSFEKPVQSMKLSANGKILAYQHLIHPDDYTSVYRLSLYSIEADQSVFSWPSPTTTRDTVLLDYTLSPDGSLLGLASGPSSVADTLRMSVIRIQDDSVLFEAEFPGERAPIISAKGDFLIQNGAKAEVYRAGKLIGTARNYPLGWLNDSLYFGRYRSYPAQDTNSIFVFHTSGKRIEGMGVPVGTFNCTVVSGSIVLVDNKYLYDITSGKRIWAAEGNTGVVFAGLGHYAQQVDAELLLRRRESPTGSLRHGHPAKSVAVQIMKSWNRLQFQIDLPKSEYVTVDTWNALGHRLERVFQGQLAAGKQVVQWNPKGKYGARSAGKACFYSVHAGAAAFSGRL